MTHAGQPAGRGCAGPSLYLPGPVAALPGQAIPLVVTASFGGV